MGLLDLFKKERKYKGNGGYARPSYDAVDDFDDGGGITWCFYDMDMVCTLFHDCQDCCYYEEWNRRGRREADNFDDYRLDEGKFDFNHYDDEDEHR